MGNSSTHRNDVPALLAEMAVEREVRLRHEPIGLGGASLRSHWNPDGATKAIAGSWAPPPLHRHNQRIGLTEQTVTPTQATGQLGHYNRRRLGHAALELVFA